MSSKYVTEFDGSEFTNCHLSEDGQLVIPFENHNLGIGEIMVDREYFLNDTDFKDGICNLVSTEKTGIILHSGATDDLGKIEVSVQPYYHVVNVGGQLPDLSEYAKKTKIVHHTDASANIQPNILNVWGEVASLDITLAEPTDNSVVNEYMVQFASGDTATTLTLPNTIKWMAAPNIQPNKTYQLSIINNLGVIGEFSHE